MPDQTTAGADATAQGTTTPASPPGQAPADAGNKTGGDVEYWKAEAKAAFVKRDKALEEFRSSDEFKALMDRAAKAAEYEKAQADAERRSAEEQGRFKELLEKERGDWAKAQSEYDAKIQAANERLAETVRMHTNDRLRDALAAALAPFKPADSEWVQEKIEKAIASGSVKVGDGGRIEGVAETTQKLVETHSKLFDASRERIQGAFAQLQRNGHRPDEQPQVFGERDAKSRPQAAPALADYQRTFMGRDRGSTNGKPRYPTGGDNSGG